MINKFMKTLFFVFGLFVFISTSTQACVDDPPSDYKKYLRLVTKRWDGLVTKCASERDHARGDQLKSEAEGNALVGGVLGFFIGGPPGAAIGAAVTGGIPLLVRGGSSPDEFERRQGYQYHYYPCLRRNANLDDKSVSFNALVVNPRNPSQQITRSYQINPSCIMDFGLSDYPTAKCLTHPLTANEDKDCDLILKELWYKCSSSNS